MEVLSRKKLEIQNRRQAIVQVARKLFKDKGYLGFNMDRVAQQMQVAKGTIYQHFANKEEVILAMAIETLEIRTAMFERAALFAGKSRERMAAIGCAAELFVRWYPDHFELEKVLSCGSIIEKTSEKLQGMKTAAEMKCIGLVAGIVRDGMACGDFPKSEFQPDQVVFGLWSNTYGGYSIMACSQTIAQMGIENGFQIVRENNNRLLDGYGWQPFSSELDYHKVHHRVAVEIFSEGSR